MFDNIRADFNRVYSTYPTASLYRKIQAFIASLANYGFLCLLVYRFGIYANKIEIPVVGFIAKIIYSLLKYFSVILFGIEISINCSIGPGMYIGHSGCIVIEGHCGKNCSIGQGVTLGSLGGGESKGSQLPRHQLIPTLGDNVYIGSGAKLLGPIHIGDNVKIGANAVVLTDIPDDMTAVGIPAKAIAVKPQLDTQN